MLFPPAVPLTRRAFLAGACAALAMITLTPRSAMSQSAAPVAKMTPDDALAAAKAGDIILIDIRTPPEWLQTGVAEEAIGLDMNAPGFVESLVALREANPETPLALICRTGNRTGYVTGALSAQGFPGLVDVAEGMVGGPNGPGWISRGLPTYEGTVENVQAKTDAVLP
jgi:rhodanese-related sulfurtransferase